MSAPQPDQYPLPLSGSVLSINGSPCQPGKAHIQDILENKRLTCHFQPIVNLARRGIFAYEALCRTIGSNPFDTIEEIFHQAKMCGMMLELDMRCRENGILQSAAQNLHERDALLFLNICPTSLLHPNHSFGATGLLARQHGFNRQDIVLEITEQDAVSNYQLFKKGRRSLSQRGVPDRH